MAGIALGTSMSAWIYDASGSYVTAWYFYLLLSAVIFILYISADREYERRVLQNAVSESVQISDILYSDIFTNKD